MNVNVSDVNWEKMDGLLPAIIQDAKTNDVLMLGYMNHEALQKTLSTRRVTFFSRARKQLWTKGETSNNQLELVAITVDCDQDALLIKANPTGPICHTGTKTCFSPEEESEWRFIQDLENTIAARAQFRSEKSYTSALFDAGLDRIAQKVGEEGVEVILAAINKSDEEFCNEAADLLFHLLVLLRARNISVTRIIQVLKQRKLF